MIMIGFLSKVQQILDTIFEDEICVFFTYNKVAFHQIHVKIVNGYLGRYTKSFLVFKVGINSITSYHTFSRVNQNSLVCIPTFKYE